MKLHEFPQEIESAALALHETGEQLQSVREQIGRIEIQVKADVIAAKDESTGKALYSNDTAREIATGQRLEQSAPYAEGRERERQLEKTKAEQTARLERLRREFQLALIDYEAERLGRRHAA